MLESTRFSVLASTFSPHRDRFMPSWTGSVPTPVQMIERAAAIHDLSGVELIHPAHVTPENLAQIKVALEANGLVCASVATSVSSKWEYQGGSLTADDLAVRRQAIETVKTGMDLAVELGTERISLWLGRDGFDYAFQIDYDQAWGRIVEALQEACAYRPEIKIGIEYKSFEPRKRLLVSTAAKAVALRHDVGAKNLGALLDTGHALYAQESLAEAVAFLARHDALMHVHFNDNYRISDDDLIVGTVNFLETMEMLYWLDRVGYDGWLSFDPHPILEDPARAVEEGCKFVRGLIGTMERIGKAEIEKAIATRQVTEMMALVNQTLFSL
ncbi:MAG: sugar phosphate isomerase/epimerase family protein [Chloroflexota bacterium]